MKALELDDIRNSQGELLCSCKSIVALRTNNIPLKTESVKTDCFVLIFCTAGEQYIRINTKVQSISSCNFAFIIPNSIIQIITNDKEESKQFSIIAFDGSIINTESVLQRKMWKMSNYLYLYPMVSINTKESYRTNLYRLMILNLFREINLPFGGERLRLMLLAVCFEIMAEYELNTKNDTFNGNRVSKSRYILQKFMEAVVGDDGSHRTVAYYANKLGYSPKHLASIVREITGKTPLGIINEHAIVQIKYRLRHTDIPIKVIASQFKFRNASFFGKFVKAHVGMSPQVYRLSDIEN